MYESFSGLTAITKALKGYQFLLECCGWDIQPAFLVTAKNAVNDRACFDTSMEKQQYVLLHENYPRKGKIEQFASNL